MPITKSFPCVRVSVFVPVFVSVVVWRCLPYEHPYPISIPIRARTAMDASCHTHDGGNRFVLI